MGDSRDAMASQVDIKAWYSLTDGEDRFTASDMLLSMGNSMDSVAHEPQSWHPSLGPDQSITVPFSTEDMHSFISGYSDEHTGYSWPGEYAGPPYTGFLEVDLPLNRSGPGGSDVEDLNPSVGNNDFQSRRCQYPGCLDTRVFKQNSAFKKHIAKHTRPYKCPVPGCTVKDFSNAGDLKRHRREVHSSPSFICPVVTCKRHSRGFGRNDNLAQHLKRAHAEGTMQLMFASTSSGDGKGMVASPNEEGLMDGESGESAVDDMELIPSKPSDKASLVAKLRELQALKEESMAKFDGDIAAVKRVLSLM